jgi:hypothetical protein
MKLASFEGIANPRPMDPSTRLFEYNAVSISTMPRNNRAWDRRSARADGCISLDIIVDIGAHEVPVQSVCWKSQNWKSEFKRQGALASIPRQNAETIIAPSALHVQGTCCPLYDDDDDDVHYDSLRCIDVLIIEQPSVNPGLHSYIRNIGMHYPIKFLFPFGQRTSKIL